MYQYYLPEQYSHSQLQHFQWMEGPFLQVPLSHLRHQILLKLNQGNENELRIQLMYYSIWQQVLCMKMK